MFRFAIAAGLLIALMLPQDLRAAEAGAPMQLAQSWPPDVDLLLPNKPKKRQKLLPYGRQQADPGMPQQGEALQSLIPESVAVRQAMQLLPGSKPLGVRLLSGARPVYAVKLRTKGQVQRVLVDALTGDVMGQ